MAEENVKEPTRRELAEALSRANSLIETQGAALATAQAQITQLLQDRPAVDRSAALPVIKKVPYKGLVRAKEPCWIGQLRKGPEVVNVLADGRPVMRDGEVFEVDVDALWSDDPYEPVIQVGVRDDGLPRVEPNKDAPTPIPFEVRARSAEVLALTSKTAQRANDWMPNSVLR